jgi:hypothetical protein
MVTPGQPNFAATCLANFIAWRGDGRVAVLTRSRRGGFADSIVGLVCARSLGKRHNGPYPIAWESDDDSERRNLWQRLAVPDRCSIPDALAALEAHAGVPAVKAATEWIARSGSLITKDRTHDAAGLRIPAAEIEQLVSSRVHRWLLDPGSIYKSNAAGLADASMQQQLVARAAENRQALARVARGTQACCPHCPDRTDRGSVP